MSTAQPANEAAIREQAYYFWEEDGRPEGRENEYWHRAMVAVSEKSQMDTLTQPPPKTAKAAPAASKAKAAPVKSAKPEPGKKPKKK